MVLPRPIESTALIRHVANTAQRGTPHADNKSFQFKIEFMANDKTRIVRILSLLVVLASCAIGVLASASPQLQPVATLDLSAAHLCCGKQPERTRVAFTSDTTVAVSLCRRGCSLSLIRWDGESLRLSGQTVTDGGAVAIYPANDGIIVSTANRTPMTWYSADLSTSHFLPPSISLFSASGKTAAEISGDRWKLYRFTGTLELA